MEFNLSDEDRKEINKVYTQVKSLIDLSRYLMSKDKLLDDYGILDNTITTDPGFLFAEEMEKLEFKLQKLYGFEENRNYHAYTFSLNGCTCDKDKIKESWGKQLKYDPNCPYHKKFLNYHNLSNTEIKLKGIL